jgi:Flp pilus assembly protein TadG
MTYIAKKYRRFGRCQRGTAAVEFALASVPLMIMLFGFIATNALFFTWSTMQNNVQYAARMMATGQVTSLKSGALSATNTSDTVSCGSTLNSTQVEYYACTGLPSWASFTVTATENCAAPSVTVSLSANASAAALADVYAIFAGKTISAQAVMMKEATCP